MPKLFNTHFLVVFSSTARPRASTLVIYMHIPNMGMLSQRRRCSSSLAPNLQIPTLSNLHNLTK